MTKVELLSPQECAYEFNITEAGAKKIQDNALVYAAFVLFATAEDVNSKSGGGFASFALECCGKSLLKLAGQGGGNE